MITAKNLAIYRDFEGDDDGWSRAGCPGGKEFTDSDWGDIRNLLQELACMKKGLVSAEYADRIRQKAHQLSDSPEITNTLLEIA